MSVLCSHCGEELMGAVNRCWRCGQTLVVHAGPQDVPPVRRSPIVGPLDAPLEAVVLEEPMPAEKSGPLRRGSPFVSRQPTLRVAGPIPQHALSEPARPPRKRSYESELSSQLAAFVSLVLAIVALRVATLVPMAAVCMALVVLGFGIWGLFGRRRGVALFGMILGCIALAWGGFGAAVQCYEWIYGVHPFVTAPPLPPVNGNQ